MYNETQLQAIKTFWKKDLEIWCKIFFKDSKQPFTFTWEIWVFVWNPDFEILWHEPYLFPDVARVAEEKGKRIDNIYYFTEWFHICFQPLDRTLNNPKYIFYNPILPLLDQPNLSEIVNLFQ